MRGLTSDDAGLPRKLSSSFVRTPVIDAIEFENANFIRGSLVHNAG